MMPHNAWIYIPLWLDLLLVFKANLSVVKMNLHSTMVRFIMRKRELNDIDRDYIYIPLWLDLL